MVPYKNRTTPQRLISTVLYGDKDFITKLEPGRVKVSTGKLARVLWISNSRLIDAIEWLKTIGILEKVEYPLRGTAILEFKIPEVFKVEEKIDG